MEAEISEMKTEVQRSPVLHKRNHRQTVRELTKILQEKEFKWELERTLREKQLTSVLRTLILVEAKLKREQKLISEKFKEKDYIISKQNNVLNELLSKKYCKHCNNSVDTVIYGKGYITSQDSSSVSLDSSNELYEVISDKGSIVNSESRKIALESCSSEENDIRWNSSQKNKNDEALELREASFSPYSNEDNTSNDYDKYDSLSLISSTDQISIISQQSKNSSETEPPKKVDTILNDDNDFDQTNNLSLSESNITVIHNTSKNNMSSKETFYNKAPVCHTISKPFHRNTFREPSFDEVESHDKWYISVSDHEDEQQKNEYRVNPVLECVNEILLQNMKDVINSPPKTPSCGKKINKNPQPIEEEKEIDGELVPEGDTNDSIGANENYYETPIQKLPNFYEIPQSIYNNYEMIGVRCDEKSPNFSENLKKEETGVESSELSDKNLVLKNKILRTPPTPPPKPSHLVSRSYIRSIPTKLTEKMKNRINLESEPDYCSISEVNLPTTPIKRNHFNIVNSSGSEKSSSDMTKLEKYTPINIRTEVTIENVSGKLNTQTPQKNDTTPNRTYIEIPKLPLVSEIIIPEEVNDTECDDKVTPDNYVRNNSSLIKTRNNRTNRSPVVISTPISSLIMSFNGRKSLDLNENKSSSPLKRNNFENLARQQNTKFKQKQDRTFLDLQQNFEEFKLDESEIEALNVIASAACNRKNDIDITENNDTTIKGSVRQCLESISLPNTSRSKDELQKKKTMDYKAEKNDQHNMRSYEYFLECTGLSSKSISTTIKQ